MTFFLAKSGVATMMERRNQVRCGRCSDAGGAYRNAPPARCIIGGCTAAVGDRRSLFAAAARVEGTAHSLRGGCCCVPSVRAAEAFGRMCVQVAFAIAGTLMAAALVAMLGDTSGHREYLAAKQAQEKQMAGSWSADHKPLPNLMLKEANARLLAKQERLATKAPGDQTSDDDESGDGDVKESVANKLFGAEAGMGGNGYQPPYEVEEDADVGVCPEARALPCAPPCCTACCVLSRAGFSERQGARGGIWAGGGRPRVEACVLQAALVVKRKQDGSMDGGGVCGQGEGVCLRRCSKRVVDVLGCAGIAVSNFPGDYIAGTDSNDYTDDLEKKMVIHR